MDLSRRKFLRNAAGLMVPAMGLALPPLSLARPRRVPILAGGGGGGGGVTFGGSDSNGGTVTSITVSALNATGSDRLGMAMVFWRNNDSQTISTMTWGGTAMTDSGAGQVGGSTISCSMFYILDTDIGSGGKDVVATLSSGSPLLRLTAFWLTGVDQTTPLDTAVIHNNDSDATPTSINVSSDSDSMVVGGFMVQANEAVSSSDTAIEEHTGAEFSDSTGYEAGTGSALDLTWTWTTTARARGIAVDVNAV